MRRRRRYRPARCSRRRSSWFSDPEPHASHGVVGALLDDHVAALARRQDVLLEVHDEWAVTERRYLSEGSMAKLYENDNDVPDDKEVGTRHNELLAG